MLDFFEPADLGVFIDETQLARRDSQQTGIVSCKELALTFSMLRADEFIIFYDINNYIKGLTPAPFDILY
jgi:polyhydroxyalkanoate synthase